MKQFNSLLEAQLGPLTFSQVADFFANSNTVSVALFSADRADLGVLANLKARFETRSFLRSKNIVYFKLRGMGEEISHAQNQYHLVSEISFLAVGISLTEVIQLCQNNQQDFFIYAGPETEGGIALYSMASKLPVQIWTSMERGTGSSGYTVLNDGTAFHFAA